VKIRLARFKGAQQALEKKYQLKGVAPRSYTESTRKEIQVLAAKCQERVDFAWTSGTTREPKQIFYPKHRIRNLQWTYVEQVALIYQHVGIDEPVLYILTNMSADNSVSNLLAREPLPRSLANFVLPYSIVYLPEVAKLSERYSQKTLHLTLLLLITPVLVAMANPSSLYIILGDMQKDWERVRKEILSVLDENWLSDFYNGTHVLDKGRETRLRKMLASPQCPSMRDLFPELRVIYCWHGGYVQPFIENLERQLAELKISFFPMFSMSTETVAYLIYPRFTLEGGLPLSLGVCYEFLPSGQDVIEGNLLKPWQLESSKQYSMVVSDNFGLKRYHTEDLFECAGFKQDTPILRFLGRVGLNYSFTGEKITDQQLLHVYENVRQLAKMPDGVFTCFPKRNDGSIPGYVFVWITQDSASASISADMFDRALMDVNEEYASKRKSERLTKPEIVISNYEKIMAKLISSDRRYADANPSQFKPLPLYRVFWDTLTTDGKGGGANG